MEELVDVLDERGMYTGKTETRANCSKYGLWHKAVCVFIINSKEQVLLQKRSANKKTWPNMWDVTAGGNVLAGEFGFQAIIRECKEELGIELNKNDITFIGSVISTNKKGDIINNYFSICFSVFSYFKGKVRHWFQIQNSNRTLFVQYFFISDGCNYRKYIIPGYNTLVTGK